MDPSPTGAATAVPEPAHVAHDLSCDVLDNGLRLVIAPDATAPVAAVNLWYRVGSGDEEPGRTGLAHLFEHMMFQGSRDVGKGEHLELVQRIGGMVNATTTLHRTNYFESAPANHLELLLWLEANRLATLPEALGQETLDNQRDVVKNEKRSRYDNVPYGTWLQRLEAMLFPAGHPYAHPTIGSMDDLDGTSVEDCLTFFGRHYSPANAVLSVVGDVDRDEVRTLVDRHFGPIAAAPVPPRPAAAIGPGVVDARQVVREPVPLPRVVVGTRAPGVDDERAAAAMRVLVQICNLRNGRLDAGLVRSRVAKDASASMFGFPGAGMVFAMATAASDTDGATLEAALLAELDGLAARPPTEDELLRAHAQLERTAVSGLQTSSGRADALSEETTLHGDPWRVARRADRYLEVGLDDLGDAVAVLSDADGRAVLVFEPDAS